MQPQEPNHFDDVTPHLGEEAAPQIPVVSTPQIARPEVAPQRRMFMQAASSGPSTPVMSQVPLTPPSTPSPRDVFTSNVYTHDDPKRRLSFGQQMRWAFVVMSFVAITAGGVVGISRLVGDDSQVAQNNSVIQEQDLSNGDLIVDQPNNFDLQLTGEALVVNGDIVTRGGLKFYNDEFVSSILQSNATAERTVTLPDASGTFCLDVNNCNFATATQFNAVQTQVDAIEVPVTGIQAGTNVTVTDLGNGTFSISSVGGTGEGDAVTLTVPEGGTGMTSFNMNGVIYGNSTGAIGVTVAGASGQCLVGNTGSAPSWANCAGIAGGATPGGLAGGDLSGTYPNPTIGKLQGTNLLINTPAAGHILVYNNTNGRWDNRAVSGDVAISEAGVASVQANSVNLGADTAGDYVASIGTVTGLTVGSNSGEGSTPSLSVAYGATANTAVQGNTSLTCPSGTGNLAGGGTIITLGTGGSCASLNVVASPSFTGLTLSTALGVASGGTGQTSLQAAINSLSGLTTEGDLLYRNSANTTRLARGSTGQCLTSSATTVLWGACTSPNDIVQNGNTLGATMTIGTNDIQDLGFETAGTTRLTITSGGDVGIGTGTPDSRLSVTGSYVPPGTTWTAATAAEANWWNSVTYGNGQFVAVAYSGTNRVMTSPDGINWTARAAAESNSWRAVTYGNGLFVAVADGGTNRIMTSPDGITWTPRSVPFYSWMTVTYGNGMFVAVDSNSNNIVTSPDGVTWTSRVPPHSNGSGSVTYGNGMFVAVSNGGSNGVSNWAMTSTNGIDWLPRMVPERNSWYSVTYGNGLFVAVASSGTNRVMTSPDGITWTARSAPIASWRSVAQLNGYFVAVSAGIGGNQVMTSPDGITWTVRTAPVTFGWQSVTAGGGKLVAVSVNGPGVMYTSATTGTAATINGNTVIRSEYLSQTAFQIQNAGGQALLTADTVTNQMLLASGVNLAPTTSPIASLRSALTLTTVESTNNTGRHTSIAIAPDGFARISHYDDTSDDLKFVQCTNADCSTKNTTTIDSTGSVGQYTSIAIGADGFARIAYYDVTNTALKFVQCTNASCSTNSQTQVDNTASVGLYASIAIGSDGFARISYYDDTSDDLKFVQCTNADCSTSVITLLDSTGNVGQFTSTKIASDGFARISYYDVTNTDVKFIQCTNTDCSAKNTTAFGTLGNQGQYTSLALDANDLAHVSFHDAGNGSNNGGLEYVRCTNPDCTTRNLSEIDGANNVGQHTSLALGADGFARIAYYDPVNFDVRYAACANADCSASKVVTLIDSLADVGQYTSLALGADGFARISYFDDTTDDLKFARCADDFCSATSSVVYTGGSSLGSNSARLRDAYFSGSGLTIGDASSAQTSIYYDQITNGLVIKNASKSDKAFQIQDTNGNAVFSVDTNVMDSSLRVTTLLPVLAANSNTYSTTLATVGDKGIFNAIALGPDGFARIVYYDQTATDVLFIRCANQKCTESVETTIDTLPGWATSIDIGPDGFARITYYYTGSDDLIYVRCTNADCTTRVTTTVDATGDVGDESAIAIGDDGFARITYYDNTNDDLKFAQCTNDDCTTSIITVVDSTGNVGSDSDIVIGPDGLPWISYRDSSAGDIKFARCTNADCTSVILAVVDDAGSVGETNSIAIGNDGFARISYRDVTNSDLKYARCTNIDCTTSNIITLDSVGFTGNNSSIQVGTDGLVRIAYHNLSAGSLNYIVCWDQNCTANNAYAIASGNNTGHRPSMVLDSNNTAYISYYSGDAKDLEFILVPASDGTQLVGTNIGSTDEYFGHLYVRTITTERVHIQPTHNGVDTFKIQNASGQALLTANTIDNELLLGVDTKLVPTSSPTVTIYTAATLTSVETTNNVGQYTSMALGADGFARIAYYDVTGQDLEFVQCTNADCSVKVSTTLESTNNVGQYTSMALGADGFARIAYYDVTGQDLEFVQCTNADCSAKVSTTLESTNNVGQYTSMALGADGFARIAYYDVTGQDLEFVQCTNADCSVNSKTTIDSTGNVGLYSSIVMGADGFARITYYDASNLDLKFVRCTNADCSTNIVTTVDGSSNFGSHTSVDMGADGFARIAYYNLGQQDLKFAQCTDADCTTSVKNLLDTTGVVGQYTTVKVAADGFARISYYDDTNDDLKFVQCMSADCTNNHIMSVDSASAVGAYASMTLGADGFARIAYYDDTNDDLKFALCNDNRCSPGNSLDYTGGSSLGQSDARLKELYLGGAGGIKLGDEGLGQANIYYDQLVNGLVIKNDSNSTTAMQIQNNTGTSLFTVDTTNMRLTVGTLVIEGTLTVSGHIVTNGDVPTITPESAATGVGATVSIEGNDTAGTITITAVGVGLSTGKLVEITFDSPYTVSSVPRVILSAANTNAAQIELSSEDATNISFEVWVGAALQDGQVYKINYWVVE